MELLNRAAEQRTQLLGSLTHEIKTPMTSIIGYADTRCFTSICPKMEKPARSGIFMRRAAGWNGCPPN